MQFFFKLAAAAILIAGASETGKRSPLLGGIIASLPLTSILALVFLFKETKDAGAAAAMSVSIFWAVLASLPLFLVLSWLLRKGVGFFPALALASVVGAAGYWVYLSGSALWPR